MPFWIRKLKKKGKHSRRQLVDKCDALYIWHKEPIYKMALKAVGGDREWALKILENCMMKAYQYIDKFDDAHSERSKSLMAAILQSELNSIYEQAWARAGILEEYKSPRFTEKERLDMDQILIRYQPYAGLIKFVEQLTHKEKELIFFRFFAGLSEEDLCKQYDMSPEEAAGRVLWVKQKISKLMVEG